MAQFFLNPKEQFQKFHGADRSKWAELAASHTVQLAFAYSMSEMARLGYSQQEIRGANMFIFIALNLSEELASSVDTQYPPQPLLDENAPPDAKPT